MKLLENSGIEAINNLLCLETGDSKIIGRLVVRLELLVAMHLLSEYFVIRYIFYAKHLLNVLSFRKQHKRVTELKNI